MVTRTFRVKRRIVLVLATIAGVQVFTVIGTRDRGEGQACGPVMRSKRWVRVWCREQTSRRLTRAVRAAWHDVEAMRQEHKERPA